MSEIRYSLKIGGKFESTLRYSDSWILSLLEKKYHVIFVLLELSQYLIITVHEIHIRYDLTAIRPINQSVSAV